MRRVRPADASDLLLSGFLTGDLLRALLWLLPDLVRLSREQGNRTYYNNIHIMMVVLEWLMMK